MKTYCTQNNEKCGTCSLANYGMDCLNHPIKTFDGVETPKSTTIRQLYKVAKEYQYKKDTPEIAISLGDLGILINYAEGIGVKDICDKHTKIIQESKQKAAKLRYHNMANSILPDNDIIYDTRYADVAEIRDWEI